MTAYYNEFDPKAAAWLRELIKEGLIAPGDVDERSIIDIKPHELTRYTQQHFFAGVGGWSYALRLAGVTDRRPVWTASCPCQPLSSAGLRQGDADERHLWPAFFNLVAECGPAEVIGEQVASGDGREWLAGIRADLEGVGYACGAADLCSAGVGAPNIRQRIYWVANATGRERGERRESQPQNRRLSEPAGCGETDRLANAGGARRDGAREGSGNDGNREDQNSHRIIGLRESTISGYSGGLADSASPSGPEQRREPREGSRRLESAEHPAKHSGPSGLGHALKPGLEGHAGDGDHGDQSRRDGTDAPGPTAAAGASGLLATPVNYLARPVGTFWRDSRTIECRDGTRRRIPLEPGLFPLAARISGRVALLRGAGNAINTELAATFIRCALTP